MSESKPIRVPIQVRIEATVTIKLEVTSGKKERRTERPSEEESDFSKVLGKWLEKHPGPVTIADVCTDCFGLTEDKITTPIQTRVGMALRRRGYTSEWASEGTNRCRVYRRHVLRRRVYMKGSAVSPEASL